MDGARRRIRHKRHYGQGIDTTFTPPKHSCARPAQSLPTSCAAPSSLQKLLAGKGAGSKCWVISENSELDGQEIDLQTALEKTIGYQMGTFISCIPGKLAYFEDEDGRYILER